MTKFTKLFAVAALAASTTTVAAAPRTQANGRPAAGNTMTKGGADDYDAELDDDAIETPRTLTAFVDFVRRAIPELALRAPELAVSQPRVLASGKPACGNVGKKMPVACIESTPAATAQVAVRK